MSFRSSLWSVVMAAFVTASCTAEDSGLEQRLAAATHREGIDLAGSKGVRNTPLSRYASEMDYKLVYVNDELFLSFHANDASDSGPYRKVSEGRYQWAEPERGTHSIVRAGDKWWYSWTYVMMNSGEVDASELSRDGN